MSAKARKARARWFTLTYGVVSVIFIVLALFAHANPYFSWDLLWEIAWQAETWTGLALVMYALTWLGDDWHPYVAIALGAGAFALLGAKRDALAIIAIALGGELFGFIVKLLVHRPRPSVTGIHVMRHRHTLSFPSGHVVHFMVFYGFLFSLAFLNMQRGAWRTFILFATGLLIVGIGLSRVYVGEHWPSDVIGGYLTGLCWLGVAVPLYERWRATGARETATEL